jgi:hypothetical protein
VARATRAIDGLRVHSLPVITDADTELLFVVVEFCSDPPRLCMVECVAQRLAGNSIDSFD